MGKISFERCLMLHTVFFRIRMANMVLKIVFLYCCITYFDYIWT